MKIMRWMLCLLPSAVGGGIGTYAQNASQAAADYTPSLNPKQIREQ